jgi:hypothetical protein
VGGSGRSLTEGTEDEFLEALAAAEQTRKPDVLVYRRKDAPDINAADPERRKKLHQWDQVEEFFGEFRRPDDAFRHHVKKYDKPTDFAKRLEEDFRDLITHRLVVTPTPTVGGPPPKGGRPAVDRVSLPWPPRLHAAASPDLPRLEARDG